MRATYTKLHRWSSYTSYTTFPHGSVAVGRTRRGSRLRRVHQRMLAAEQQPVKTAIAASCSSSSDQGDIELCSPSLRYRTARSSPSAELGCAWSPQPRFHRGLLVDPLARRAVRVPGPGVQDPCVRRAHGVRISVPRAFTSRWADSRRGSGSLRRTARRRASCRLPRRRQIGCEPCMRGGWRLTSVNSPFSAILSK